MKKIMLMAVAFISITTLSFGQSKKAVQTVTIKTPTVQCDGCKKRIEDHLARHEGITKVNVDYKKKITKVTFISDRTNIENIKTDIANVGYDADDVTANPESYERLPKCCKKTEDGGGHEKQ